MVLKRRECGRENCIGYIGRYAEKWFPEKWSPKNGTRVKWSPKNGPRKNILQKLFSIKTMLGNLKDFFIFIDWFHYTHKKMFDVYITILHMHQTVEH